MKHKIINPSTGGFPMFPMGFIQGIHDLPFLTATVKYLDQKGLIDKQGIAKIYQDIGFPVISDPASSTCALESPEAPEA
jgi:hypothetical protein